MSSRNPRFDTRHPYRWTGAGLGTHIDPVHPDRARDILDTLLSQIDERQRQPVTDMVAHSARNADPTRLRQCLEPCRDVNAVAVNIAVLRDHVAEVDADPKVHSLVRRHLHIEQGHTLLHLDGAAYSLDHAGKFNKHSIARRPHDPATVLGDLWVNQLTAQ